jgi:ABC-type sugar transport system permease subunit
VLRTRRLWTVAFLFLPLLVYTIVVIVPLFTSFYYSFTDYNGFNPRFDFVGVKNYLRITTDPIFFNAIKNTVIWMIAAIIIPSGFGLAIALVLQRNIWGANVFKSLFYLPICLSLAVIGQVWIWIYHPDWGLLNLILKGVHLPGLTDAWLGDPHTALIAVIIAWCWQQIGLAMVIYLSGLTSIPGELTEAAEIDGASYWQSLRYVIIPLLAPASVVVIALAIINSLKSFDVLYIMTKGGPFHSSDTLAMMMYNESFQKYYIGYGSAVSVVLFLIAMVIIVIYFRQVRSMENLYD